MRLRSVLRTREDTNRIRGEERKGEEEKEGDREMQRRRRKRESERERVDE